MMMHLRALTSSRETLGPEAYRKLYNQGARLTPSQAVARASGAPRTRTTA